MEGINIRLDHTNYHPNKGSIIELLCEKFSEHSAKSGVLATEEHFGVVHHGPDGRGIDATF